MLQSLITISLCVLLEHAARIIFSDFITLSYNTGAAFGILKNSPRVALTLSAIECVILFFMISFARLKTPLKISLSVMLGGALSNLIERIFFGHVIDWIPFPFLFSDLNFNIADVEISLGALTAFLFSVK